MPSPPPKGLKRSSSTSAVDIPLARDSVVVVADRASRAGVVAKVMDEVRLGGIKEVAIAADPGAGG